MPTYPDAYGLIVSIASYRFINPLSATVVKDSQVIHSALAAESLGGRPVERRRHVAGRVGHPGRCAPGAGRSGGQDQRRFDRL